MRNYRTGVGWDHPLWSVQGPASQGFLCSQLLGICRVLSPPVGSWAPILRDLLGLQPLVRTCWALSSPWGLGSNPSACCSLSGKSWKVSSRNRWRKATIPPTSGRYDRLRTSWPAPPTQSSQLLPWVCGCLGICQEWGRRNEVGSTRSCLVARQWSSCHCISRSGQRDAWLYFWRSCELKTHRRIICDARNEKGRGDFRGWEEMRGARRPSRMVAIGQ